MRRRRLILCCALLTMLAAVALPNKAQAAFLLEYQDTALQQEWTPYAGGPSALGPGNGPCTTQWDQSILYAPGWNISGGYATCNNQQSVIEIRKDFQTMLSLRSVKIKLDFSTLLNGGDFCPRVRALMFAGQSVPQYVGSINPGFICQPINYQPLELSINVPPQSGADAVNIIVLRVIYDSYGAPPPNLSYVGLTVDYPVTTPTPYATRTLPPTNYPTYTPLPTYTPRPTFTPLPSNYPTASPTVPQITRQSPPLTPAATVDTCNQSDLSQPCGTFASFPTLSLPTLDLPSPTAIALLPTNTQRVVTTTPSYTPSPTPGVSSSVTPQGTPITAMLDYPKIDSCALLDLQKFSRDSLATFLPLNDFTFNVGGTPSGISEIARQLGSAAGQPIAIFKSFENTDFNRGAGMITFGVFAFVVWIFGEIIGFILPFILGLFRLILQVI